MEEGQVRRNKRKFANRMLKEVVEHVIQALASSNVRLL
jgi:hypothetical protein